jgi:hypothetical protein
MHSIYDKYRQMTILYPDPGSYYTGGMGNFLKLLLILFYGFGILGSK